MLIYNYRKGKERYKIMTKTMTYHGRTFLFIARHEIMSFEGYEEWYCPETGEGLNVWDDGQIEIFECED